MYPSSYIATAEELCINTVGAPVTLNCYEGTADYPNLCYVGACGCALNYSESTTVCDCGGGNCFDSEFGCVYKWLWMNCIDSASLTVVQPPGKFAVENNFQTPVHNILLIAPKVAMLTLRSVIALMIINDGMEISVLKNNFVTYYHWCDYATKCFCAIKGNYLLKVYKSILHYLFENVCS